MRQLTLKLQPDTTPSLDNFVVSQENEETFSGLSAWLTPPFETSLLLWGDHGSGKTHLLKASGALYLDAQQDPDLACLGGNPDETCLRHAVDHIEHLSAQGQITLFNLFNRQKQTQQQLLTAANTPPAKLPLREDLRTRLGSGLVFRLRTLTESDQISALKTLAHERHLQLPEEAWAYLGTRAPRDMRTLSSLLIALDAYSLEHKRPITLPLLREVLQTTLPEMN